MPDAVVASAAAARTKAALANGRRLGKE